MVIPLTLGYKNYPGLKFDIFTSVILCFDQLMIQVLQLKKDLGECQEKHATLQRKHEEHLSIYNKRHKDQLHTNVEQLSQKVHILFIIKALIPRLIFRKKDFE